MELQVIFDRVDRLYRFGDTISGSVVVQPDTDKTYSEIWITYRWRTHGRGDRDMGKEEKLTWAEKITFKAGDCGEVRFRFPAPNGPVTYHGYLLNVDWYLTAHARSGLLGHIKSEQDFLLQAGDPTGAVVLGAKQIPRKDLPARPTEMPAPSNDWLEVKAGSRKAPGLWSIVKTVLFVVLFICIWGLITHLYPGLVLVTILFAVVAGALFRLGYKRKLKLGEVWVRPASVYPGSMVYCHVDFVAKRGFHLRSIKASISARERVTKTQGTTTETNYHNLDEKSYTRSFNEDVSEGRWIAFDCSLPVGRDLPASFSSTNNTLEWTVTMKAEIKGWPAWQKTIPITVLPQRLAPAAGCVSNVPQSIISAVHSEK